MHRLSLLLAICVHYFFCCRMMLRWYFADFEFIFYFNTRQLRFVLCRTLAACLFPCKYARWMNEILLVWWLRRLFFVSYDTFGGLGCWMEGASDVVEIECRNRKSHNKIITNTQDSADDSYQLLQKEYYADISNLLQQYIQNSSCWVR